MPGITAITALIVAAALMVAAHDVRMRCAWLMVAIAAALGWWYAPQLLLYAPPAVINVAFGLYFGTTLAPGREPRIATFARRVIGGDLPADRARYARGVTWIWTVFFFASAAAGLALAALAPLQVWSAFVNVVSYLLVAALFVGEYAYRRRRFPQHRHASLWAVIRAVAQERRASPARTSQWPARR